jgi:SpoVK/Ycf46/Vps4 family AAA+-type ATPase
MSDFLDENYEFRDVFMGDFEIALEKCKLTVSETDLEEYEEWTEEFGQNGK